jgi:WD40 repeat protein
VSFRRVCSSGCSWRTDVAITIFAKLGAFLLSSKSYRAVVPSIFGFPKMSSVVLRIDRKYFANDPSGSVDQLIDAEAVRLDAYLGFRPLEGHTGSVNAVAVTPDGHRAVSASFDRMLRLWDVESGKEIATFTGEGEVSSCAVAPDGRTIIAGERSGRVHFGVPLSLEPKRALCRRCALAFLNSRPTTVRRVPRRRTKLWCREASATLARTRSTRRQRPSSSTLRAARSRIGTGPSKSDPSLSPETN